MRACENMAKSHADVSVISVLAGTNGSGKSSVGGKLIIKQGGEYFNPDDAAKRLLAANPFLTQTEANSEAWAEGKTRLEAAIRARTKFTLETTLGGHTIPALLRLAAEEGHRVRVWYVGLSSPELNIARVRARVAKGGHEIPEDTIRERYSNSVLHLIELMPYLAELAVFDNSKEADPDAGVPAEPTLVLHMMDRCIVASCELADTPAWAKPILSAAFKITR